ncbi:MAG: hypothetical protein K8L99_18785 [Anaerolineae bacterium]|nr:hypothetical protein [Anaerolineae bacterium]
MLRPIRRLSNLLIIVSFLHIGVVFAQEDSPPINDLGVVNIMPIDLQVNPSSAAYLAPDGSQLAYLTRESICFYALPAVSETSCTPVPEDAGVELESAVWSPDSRYLALMDNDVLRMLIDSDILLVDSQNGTLTNLTDDGARRIPLGDESEGPLPLIDLSPQWMDDTTLVFIRYELGEEEQFTQGALYTLSVEGGEPELLRELTPRHTSLSIYRLNWLPYTEQYLYYHDDGRTRILLAVNDQGQQIVLADSKVESMPTVFSTIDLSADGQYVLRYDWYNMGRLTPDAPVTAEDSIAQVIDAESSVTALIDPAYFVREAGWSPAGEGLAYIVSNGPEEESGLYLTSAVGEAGQLLLAGEGYGGTTPSRMQPLTWASNNTILLSDRAEGFQLVLVELGS